MSKRRHEPTVPRIAFLFPGLLRLFGQNRDVVRALAQAGRVFFYTTRDHASDVAAFDAPCEAHFVEDNPQAQAVEAALDDVDDGWKIKQFYKLRQCYERLCAYERSMGTRFDLVYKLRTDLWFPPDFSLNFAAHLARPDSVFMESDWYFGGARAAADSVFRFHDVIFQRYYGRYGRYWPVDPEVLLRSDFGAGRFDRLCFPTEVVGPYEDRYALYERLVEARQRLKTHIPRAAEPVRTLHPHPAAMTMAFAPEPSFLHYVLSLGYDVQPMSRFAPPHPRRRTPCRIEEIPAFGGRLLQREGLVALVRFIAEARLSAPEQDIVLGRLAAIVCPDPDLAVKGKDLEAAEALISHTKHLYSPSWSPLLTLLRGRKGAVAS